MSDGESSVKTDADQEDYTLEELENQEWPEPGESSGYVEHEFMDGTQMVFQAQDPETEAIMNYIGPNTGDQTQSERQYNFITSVFTSPQIPLERWRQWRSADQTALSRKAAEFVGVDKIVDFRAEDLDELMSDSPDE